MRNCSTLNRCTTRRSAKCHNIYRKGTSEEEKPDLLKPGFQRTIDGVAMGTGVSTHMEVMGCWKLCRAEWNHLEGSFRLWQWWTALKKTTTHKCKCRISGRKVMEIHCGEAFGWIVVYGCCLRCDCNLFSDSAWRLLCGCSSAPRHSYVYLHLHGCSWTTLSAKTSSEHQLLFR